MKLALLKLVIYAGQITLCHAKIEKIPIKIFVMINNDGGRWWTIFRFYKGGHRSHGGPQSSPLAKTLKDVKTRTKSHYS